jgi:predicted regulator of Ras-like GTPase activity (Roadblock/LC7/MglB family)
MRENNINAVLAGLNGGSADIEASALVSRDGLIIASALSAGMDEDRVSAIVAAILSLGDRMSSELYRGDLEQVMISGKQGHVLIIQAGNDAVLCTIANKAIKLGLLFLDANRAAQALSQLV